MRLVLQRVRMASVCVDGKNEATIGPGILCLAGFGKEDTPELPTSPAWSALLNKLLDLRIFPDAAQKMNLCLREFSINGAPAELLLVSQFTLYADCRKGRRPSFDAAAPPERALALYDRLVKDFAALLPNRVQSGIFGADMDVQLINWGPVTIQLEC